MLYFALGTLFGGVCVLGTLLLLIATRSLTVLSDLVKGERSVKSLFVKPKAHIIRPEDTEHFRRMNEIKKREEGTSLEEIFDA